MSAKHSVSTLVFLPLLSSAGWRPYLWAHEVDKDDGHRAGQGHPDPDLPAHVLQRDTTGEDGDEGEEPLPERPRGSARMTKLEGCDLVLKVSK